jgi:hypothetical protein
MEGWLQKKGHIFSTLKKRFFVLEDRTLSYYETDDLKKKKGEYVLDADSRVEINTSNPLMFTLFAIGSGGQELELLATEQSQVGEWKRAFESARALFVDESTQVQQSLEKNGLQVPLRMKGSGGQKGVSGVHVLTDIGISNTLKVSHEMQITYEVIAHRNGVVLQYDEAVSPASEELPRSPKGYLQAFETASAPAVVKYSHTEGEFYTLLLVDLDFPSVQNPLFREHVKWVSVSE